jgi:hypothetical protein
MEEAAALGFTPEQQEARIARLVTDRNYWYDRSMSQNKKMEKVEKYIRDNRQDLDANILAELLDISLTRYYTVLVTVQHTIDLEYDEEDELDENTVYSELSAEAELFGTRSDEWRIENINIDDRSI